MSAWGCSVCGRDAERRADAGADRALSSWGVERSVRDSRRAPAPAPVVPGPGRWLAGGAMVAAPDEGQQGASPGKPKPILVDDDPFARVSSKVDSGMLRAPRACGGGRACVRARACAHAVGTGQCARKRMHRSAHTPGHARAHAYTACTCVHTPAHASCAHACAHAPRQALRAALTTDAPPTCRDHGRAACAPLRAVGRAQLAVGLPAQKIASEHAQERRGRIRQGRQIAARRQGALRVGFRVWALGFRHRRGP